jgi:hypothetical protein
MEGQPPGAPWNTTVGFTVKRPTKLIDGSRGGQAFIAEFLAPEENKHYSIADQSRMQLLSVLLVGAGLTRDDKLEAYVDEVLPADFDMSAGLGSIFARLSIGLALFSGACIAMLVCTWWSILRHNMMGGALPWITKILSLSCWAVGAIGLLMLGGNPRVKLIAKKQDAHIQRRLVELGEKTVQERISASENGGRVITNPIVSSDQRYNGIMQSAWSQRIWDTLIEKKTAVETTITKIQSAPLDEPPRESMSNKTMVKVQFGSLHGSIFTPDRGYCYLPLSLVERICELDIKTVRSWGWLISTGWFSLLLLAGVTLQIGGALRPSFGADLMSLTFLLLTSLARGAGVSGPEKWMIPKWKRRPNTKNGAILLGQYSARNGAEDA